MVLIMLVMKCVVDDSLLNNGNMYGFGFYSAVITSIVTNCWQGVLI